MIQSLFMKKYITDLERCIAIINPTLLMESPTRPFPAYQAYIGPARQSLLPD